MVVCHTRVLPLDAMSTVNGTELVQKIESKGKGLPPGWRREIVVRKNGMSAGKTDVYYYRYAGGHCLSIRVQFYISPFLSPCGKKFRSKPQIARFLGENADLACFDFSRAGTMADGTQRRRARDRNPQGFTRKLDQRPQVVTPAIRPLTINPLRASGPIRRTCGVIKLPVMLLSPPAGDVTLRDSVLGQQGVADQKSHSLNVVVQSHWDRRFKSLNPQDHISGKEITRKELQQQAALSKSAMPTSNSLATPLQQSISSIPSLLNSHSGVLHSTTPISASTQPSSLNSTRAVPVAMATGTTSLTGTKLLQQAQQLKALTNPSPSSSPSLSAPHIPQRVTDNDVILQEQRVQLLRQQLLAAQGGL